MELLEGIETRRSYRAFKSTDVSRETIERILQAAGKSPSYKNTQPWEVAVVRGKKKEELSGISEIRHTKIHRPVYSYISIFFNNFIQSAQIILYRLSLPFE